MPTTINKFILFAGCMLFITGLILFVYLGIFTRYWADDWCYNADFKELGAIGALKGYTYITTYAANRFSLTLFSGLLYQAGVLGVQLMTPLAITVCLIGLVWTLNNVKIIAKLTIPPLAIILSAAILVYYALYTAPHLYQSFYWRSGFLPYTAPLILSCRPS